jgi:adenylate cyclase
LRLKAGPTGAQYGLMPDPGQKSDEFWRDFLSHPDTLMRRGRHILMRLPADPRCRLCAGPFTGAGGMAMRLIGKRQSTANPNYCTSCESMLLKHHGGAEVTGSFLFADIRGSTALAEGISPTEYRQLLDRFYTAASETVFSNDGMVDKFVGDELMAVFPPMLGEADHSARAVACAQALMRVTGQVDPDGPWVPIGAGVHTGLVWFGAIGEGAHVEMTIVGDPVNVTARLAAAAEPGEILVSAEAAAQAGLDGTLPRRTLDLKGKSEPIEVVSLRVTLAVAAR